MGANKIFEADFCGLKAEVSNSVYEKTASSPEDYDHRYYLGLDRNCDACKGMDSKALEQNGLCSRYKSDYCWVWRDKIEKVEI